ncbi:putative antitoxin [Burkholderia cenocepacia H111]|nr:putative antitoxin [Burkholderia cenocepacia H111]
MGSAESRRCLRVSGRAGRPDRLCQPGLNCDHRLLRGRGPGPLRFSGRGRLTSPSVCTRRPSNACGSGTHQPRIARTNLLASSLASVFYSSSRSRRLVCRALIRTNRKTVLFGNFVQSEASGGWMTARFARDPLSGKVRQRCIVGSGTSDTVPRIASIASAPCP